MDDTQIAQSAKGGLPGGKKKAKYREALYYMKQQGFVSFVTGLLLRQMGEYINGKLLAYDKQNVLLPAGPDDDTPVLSIVLTDRGKEVVVGADGVKRTRIQQVLHDRQIKEQDFTETFLRRGGFTFTDAQWFKANAWPFTNLAHVVEQREKAKDRKIQKAVKAGKQQPVSRGAPALSRRPRTEEGAARV
eukprot:Tamp_08582.p3 GENE.Tamp_08582~~Tamp_08582.p3  ORF type:complete len:189 (-),score=48.58 Tamp_08582:1524-2090(-)